MFLLQMKVLGYQESEIEIIFTFMCFLKWYIQESHGSENVLFMQTITFVKGENITFFQKEKIIAIYI